MATSPNERPPSAPPPTTEEAERVAERFRPSWEIDAGSPAEAAPPPPPPPPPPLPPPNASAPSSKPTGRQTAPTGPAVVVAPTLSITAPDTSEPLSSIFTAPPLTASPEPVSPASSVKPAPAPLQKSPLQKSPLKQTLVGLPAMVADPSPSAPSAAVKPGAAPTGAERADSAGTVASPALERNRKMTLVGVAPPAPDPPTNRENEAAVPSASAAPGPSEPAPDASVPPAPAPAAEPASLAPALSGTPAVEISVEEGPIETIHATELGAEERPDAEKPTGFAKPYVPREAGAPLVVVEEDVLRAGELAAQAEASAKRARQQKNRRAPTIPGTMRALPRASTASSELDITTTPEFRPRRSKSPLIVVLVGSLLGAGVVAALLLDRLPGLSQPEPPTAEPIEAPSDVPPPAPVSDVPPPPPAIPAEPTTAEAPPAAESAAPAPDISAPAVPQVSAERKAAAPPVSKIEPKPRVSRKVAPARKPVQKRTTTTPVTPAPKSKPVIVRDNPF